MPVKTIHTRVSRASVRGAIRALGPMLAGRAPDRLGIVHGIKMRVAVSLLSRIKQAFIVKSRGGTDEAGITWPPLSKKYLAYERRFGRGEQAALKRAAGLGSGHRFAPGGSGGLLSKAQEKRWWEIYRRNLAWMAAKGDIADPKARAAAVAWATIKREGAKTKLEVFGNRKVDIGRDTGVLFNSLSPGTINGNDYAPPSSPGGEQQVVQDNPGELLVGTNVEYAGHFMRRRPIWPLSGPLPLTWRTAMNAEASQGVVAALIALTEEA